MLPDIGRLRGGTRRSEVLRLVHTHLNGENLSLDDLGDLTLLRLDLIAAIQVDEAGNPGRIELAQILPGSESGRQDTEPFRKIQSQDVHSLEFDFEAEIRALEN